MEVFIFALISFPVFNEEDSEVGEIGGEIRKRRGREKDLVCESEREI